MDAMIRRLRKALKALMRANKALEQVTNRKKVYH